MSTEECRGRFRVSSSGTLIEVDDAGARLFGFEDSAPLLGAGIASFLVSPREAPWLSPPWTGTCRCRRHDGSVWVAYVDSRVDEGDGATVLSVEGALESVNELVASVLDAIPNIVFLKDRQHRSLFINAQFAEFMGVRREDIIGKYDHEFIPKAEADVFAAIDDAVFETGRTWENEEFMTDAAGRRHAFITRKSLHTDAGGRRVLLGVSTDITARKEVEDALRRARDELEQKVAERTRDLDALNHRLQSEIHALEAAREHLRESEERYRAVFETTGTANVLVDPDGVIVVANAGFARLVEVRREDLERKRRLAEFADAGHRLGLETELGVRGEEPRSFEVRLRTAAGRVRDAIATLSVIPGRSDRLVSLLDVTERKRASEELLRAEKMAALGQIIAGVAHEINNPNNFVYFNLPILRRYLDALRPFVEGRLDQDPGLQILDMPAVSFLEDVDRLVENMHHGSQRITAIVAELKKYIRRDEGEERHPGSVERVVGDVMTLIGKQVRKMVKRFDVEVTAPLPRVVMSAGRIEQVLINLLINAGQAADKEDSWLKLRVHARGDGAEVEITVSDNGCGMSAEVAKHAFDPFFTTKEREGGTGLGLAIAQRIVAEHEGSIQVASTEHQGTTFTVVLPAARGARS